MKTLLKAIVISTVLTLTRSSAASAFPIVPLTSEKAGTSSLFADSTLPETFDETVTTYGVVNPSSGIEWRITIRQPRLAMTPAPLPAIIMYPGGTSDSSLFDSGTDSASRLASFGFNVVTLDPEGRGETRGIENHNGSIDQDGLIAVAEFVKTLDFVDADRVGFFTNSYGVTAAAGALARHPDLKVRFLIDWEGPADRNDTAGCDGGTGHLADVAACDDEAFWSEREAVRFLPEITVPYVRMQSVENHVPNDTVHALAMVDAATSGTSPWTALNANDANVMYDLGMAEWARSELMLPEEETRYDTTRFIAAFAKRVLMESLPR